MGQWPVDKIDRTLRSRSKLEDVQGQSGQFGIPVQEGWVYCIHLVCPKRSGEASECFRYFWTSLFLLILKEISGNGRKDE